jgi:glutamate 5-kinase
VRHGDNLTPLAPEVSQANAAQDSLEVPTTEVHPAIGRLEALHLQKSYGKRQVVKDVSLAVKTGEVVGLLGPNGAGKTTSFYMIVGLVRASAGEITIDDGAEAALLKGKSLLPAGVKSVKGDFARGDAIVVKTQKGKAVARGLSAYAAQDIQKILGLKTDRLEEVLGYKGRAEIIHRDDLVLTP